MEHLCYCGKKIASKRLVLNQGEILICEDSKCKEKIEAELDASFRESHQGRSRQNYEYSAKITMWSIGLALLILLGVSLYHLISC